MERKEKGKAQKPQEPLKRLLLCDVDGTLLIDGSVREEDARWLQRWKEAGNGFGLVTQKPQEPLKRLLLCDVDGTLLIDGSVREEDARWLQRWKEAGNGFGLVTGRGEAFCRELCPGRGCPVAAALERGGKRVRPGDRTGRSLLPGTVPRAGCRTRCADHGQRRGGLDGKPVSATGMAASGAGGTGPGSSALRRPVAFGLCAVCDHAGWRTPFCAAVHGGSGDGPGHGDAGASAAFGYRMYRVFPCMCGRTAILRRC